MEEYRLHLIQDFHCPNFVVQGFHLATASTNFRCASGLVFAISDLKICSEHTFCKPTTSITLSFETMTLPSRV